MIGEQHDGQFRIMTHALVLRNISAVWWQCGQVTFNVWTISPPKAIADVRRGVIFRGDVSG